jgi:non-ribosomal peptide synthetase component F
MRETALRAYAHQDVPFEKIVEVVRPVRDPSRNPVFQANFRVGNAPPELSLPGIEAQALAVDAGISRFDLAIDLTHYSDGLRGHLEYDTGLFSEQTADRLAQTFLALVAAVAQHPDTSVLELEPVRRTRRLHEEAA